VDSTCTTKLDKQKRWYRTDEDHLREVKWVHT
jgi:hypothetical protein